MSYYSLDTNACIAHLRSQGMSPLSLRLKATDPRTIVICSVVRTELLFGAYRAAKPAKAVAETEHFFSPFLSSDFDDNAAKRCAQLRADLRSRNQQIGPYDSLIAAIADVNGHTLVTRNIAEFSRVPGLRLENWQ